MNDDVTNYVNFFKIMQEMAKMLFFEINLVTARKNIFKI